MAGPRDALLKQLGAPYFPLDVPNIKAKLEERVIAPYEAVPLDGMTMVAMRLRHPQQSLGYVAVFDDGTRAAFVWDHEYGDREIDDTLEQMVRGADVLVMDATYTVPEYDSGRKGWGHCTNVYAATLAARAGVGKLVLTHHDPRHTDGDIDEMVWEAQKIFRNTTGAREGVVMSVRR